MNEPTNEEIQNAIDAEEAGGEETPEPGSPEPEKPGAELAKPATYEIDGKQYTADQVRDFIKGSMRLEDYSRDKNTLAEERREFQRQRQEFIDSQRRPAEREESEDQDIPLTRQEFQQWQQEQAVEQFKARLSDVYDQTFEKLCAKHGITDPEVRELYDLHINGANPTLANAQDVVQKVTALFDQYHERLGKLSKTAVEAEHGKLKKLPKPPSAKGEGAAPMATGDKPKKSFNDPISAEEIAGLTG